MRVKPFSDTPTVGHSPHKSVAITVLVTVVLLVGLSAAWNTRQMQHRMKCAGNMENIGTALAAYFQRQGAAPDSLLRLRETGQLGHGDLTCPATGLTNYSYDLHSSPSGVAGRVLVFEPITNHGKGAHVLFADRQLQFVPREQFPQVVPDR